MFYHDAEEIMKIKAPTYEIYDIVAWHYEKHGKFMVISAYRLAGSLNIKQPTASSNARNGE
jgi:hypothetical protein